MFKVITPIERKDGGKFWMRLGNAYVNKDNSINVYLDAVPLVAGRDGQGVTLQLRELTDDELRERAEKRATYASRSSLSPLTPPSPASGGVDAVPF
ncbi:MAG TPA: hypothetical protein VFS15_23965 [Kofleriaceae bacterium]|nr:hypothetical protein [Kofleriaceae bacterium]